MRIELYRHLWGFDGDLETYFEPGGPGDVFDGIEAGLVWLDDDGRATLRRVLEGTSRKLIGMCFTDLPFEPKSSVDEHVVSLAAQIEELLPFAPVRINVHAGRDDWSLAEAHAFFDKALALVAPLDVPVCFETHRGRVLGHPPTAVQCVERFGDLRLCADLSHWVVGYERLLDPAGWPRDAALFDSVVPRFDHIHARVGQEEAPQVSDPRCAEWAGHVEAFESYWRRIATSCRARGVDTLSVTPEYGPPPYLPVLPGTQEPVAELDAIVRWAAHRLRQVLES